MQRFIDDRSACRRVGDFAIKRVTYTRRHGVLGRRYLVGRSVQFTLPKCARRYAFEVESGASGVPHEEFLDIDINNCYTQLLCNQLEALSVDTRDFRELFCFRDHYRTWRQFITEHSGTPMKVAKRTLIKLIHLGRSSNDIPFLGRYPTRSRRQQKEFSIKTDSDT